MECKKTNWSLIKFLFKEKTCKTPIKEELIERVINQAPNAAYEYLILLYKTIQNKENIFILNKINEDDEFKKFNQFLPKFMRPTANNILRDTEIYRIKDNKTRNQKIDDVLLKHQENLRNEREQFVQNKQLSQYNPKLKLNKKSSVENKLSNRRASKIDKQGNAEHHDDNSHENQLTNPNPLPNKKEDTFFTKFKEENKNFNDYSFEFIMKEIIQKNFLDGDHDMDLELKKFHDEDNIILFFFVKFNACSDFKLNKIFQSYKDKQPTFIDVISKTLIELSSFLQ